MDTAPPDSPARIAAEAARRRTFAVISHPDAGKSTLTEALVLHAHAIGEAGSVHGKAGRRATVSDWMDLEQARGISISSSALQFPYSGAVINLVDTPGHADFSEDTYRVLAAVDCAVMLIDAAKGMEPQTMKLFGVCQHRAIPIITVINKWDRPGRDPLELLDEIEARTGMRPTPLTLPVGTSGDFRGVLDRASGQFVEYTRTPGGAKIAGERRIDPDAAAAEQGQDWESALEQHELLSADGLEHDRAEFLAGRSTPVLFAAAVLNFGVSALLEFLHQQAPAPGDRLDSAGAPRPIAGPFSAQVFKVQAGMDAAHRDRVAFARVCSGVFHRGDVVTHEPSGRAFATKYVHSSFGRSRETIEVAFPGDVIGLVNASALRAGDSLYAERAVRFPPMPLFAPEHFAVVRALDASRYKQFRRGVIQLDQEGVVQVLRSERRGEHSPVLAVVGPMQFEVFSHRMRNEFSAPVALDTLPYATARRVAADQVAVLGSLPNIEVMTRSDGALLALFRDDWHAEYVARMNAGLNLQPLIAGTT